MNRPINEGLIYTTDACIGCNRCIAECPVTGANIAVFKDSVNHILVDQTRCIACGRCLSTCTHHARAYRDDMEEFLYALDRGEQISVLVSPAFFISYGNKAGKLLSYLKSRGVSQIYNTGYGSDIMIWACLKYIGDHADSSGLITQQCSCVVDYIEKYHPDLISRLFPIQSPAMCMATYAREYLGNTDKLAYIGSCISKKTEFETCGQEPLIDYNITFSHLDYFTASVNLNQYEDYTDVPESNYLFPSDSHLVDNLRNFLGNERLIRQVDGIDNVYKYINKHDERIKENKEQPFIIGALSCSKGCLFGSGCQNNINNEDDLLLALHRFSNKVVKKGDAPYIRSMSPNKRAEFLFDHFASLDPAKFQRVYTNRQIAEKDVTEKQINDIFNTMHKTTEISRIIDCHSCGYHSCRNMAKAIALGYTQKDNCVQYMKDENTRLFLTDVFTEIPNLNSYSKYCNNLLKTSGGSGYAALRFNIRNFTLINKNYGLKAGDLAIKEFATSVCSFVEQDEIIARISEDNFIGMVRTENLEKMIRSLNCVVLHINTMTGMLEYPVSVHLGVYTLDGHDRFAGDIIRKMATTFSFIRRKHGNKIVYFDDELANSIHKEMSIERMLPDALKNNEFIVYYQPKISIENKVMEGAEALVRWTRQGILISPADFIPISEESGFVCKIDFFVLEHICIKLREWLDAGFDPVTISVNFSKKHFVYSDVAKRISDVINRHNVPAKYIEIEFTETAYTDGYDNLALTLIELKNYGIFTSIDDFGSGYSSLNLLQDLDFSALKLDKSLLGTKCYDEKNRTVIANIIRMAKELNMQIVAEGVETIDEYNLLEQLSCDLIQGYIFDKPLPEEEFVKHLKDKSYSL